MDNAYANVNTGVENNGLEYTEIGAKNKEPEYANAETIIREKNTFEDEVAPEYYVNISH